jgi:hypothetical protein
MCARNACSGVHVHDGRARLHVCMPIRSQQAGRARAHAAPHAPQISEYQEAASEAETKLAALLTATVRAGLRPCIGCKPPCTTQTACSRNPHHHQTHMQRTLPPSRSPACMHIPPPCRTPPPQEYEALVGKVVRMVLFKQHEKPGVPVKRQELLDATTVRPRGEWWGWNVAAPGDGCGRLGPPVAVSSSGRGSPKPH